MPHRAIQFQKMQTHSQAVQTGNCHEQATSKLYNRHLHLRNPRAGDSVVRGAENPLVSSLSQSTGNINEIMLRTHLHYYVLFFFFFFQEKTEAREAEDLSKTAFSKIGCGYLLVKIILFTLNSEITLPWCRNCFLTDTWGMREKQCNAEISAVAAAWIGHSFSC